MTPDPTLDFVELDRLKSSYSAAGDETAVEIIEQLEACKKEIICKGLNRIVDRMEISNSEHEPQSIVEEGDSLILTDESRRVVQFDLVGKELYLKSSMRYNILQRHQVAAFLSWLRKRTIEEGDPCRNPF